MIETPHNPQNFDSRAWREAVTIETKEVCKYLEETLAPCYLLNHPTLGRLLFCGRICPPLLAPLFIEVFFVRTFQQYSLSGKAWFLRGLLITGETKLPLSDLERCDIVFADIELLELKRAKTS